MLALVVGLQLLLASCSAEPADLPGHMKPLGSHRDPELVTRIVHAPSVVEFQQEYAQPRRPLVMEGILANTDLIKNWQQDEYLRCVCVLGGHICCKLIEPLHLSVFFQTSVW